MSALEQSQAQFIESHARELLSEVPEPSAEWQRRDLPDGFPWSLATLDQYGIISKEGERDGAAIWSTKQDAYDRMKSRVDRTEYPLPCHSGIRNIGGDKPYTCTNDMCDKRFTRDEVNWDAFEG